MRKRAIWVAQFGWVAVGLGVASFLLMIAALAYRNSLSGPNATECYEPGGPPLDCTSAQIAWSDRAGVLITMSLVLLAIGAVVLTFSALRGAYQRHLARSKG